MNKGFTAAEQKKIGAFVSNIESEIEKLLEFLGEKHERGDVYHSERSEKWQQDEAGQIFNDWLEELDYKKDDLESWKDEFSLERFEDVF